MRKRTMHQRFFQGFVRILILHVFADNSDRYLGLGIVDAVDKFIPLFKVALFGFQVQVAQHQGVNAFT